MLAELLGRAASGRADLVLADDLDGWPDGALAALEAVQLLARVDNGTTLRCDGCEDRCLVTPEWRRPRARPPSLVHPCHRPRDIGLVVLDPDGLRRWRIDADGFAAWLGSALHLVGRPERRPGAPVWHLGDRTVEGMRRSVFLALGDVGPTVLAAPNAVVLAGDGVRVEGAAAVPLAAIVRLADHGFDVDDAAFVAALAPVRRRTVVAPLAIPAGLRWDQVILRVLDEELIEVVLGREPPRRCEPSDLGMVDGRNGQPTEAWKLLLELADAGGTFDWGTRGADSRRKARVAALRRALEAAIPAEGEAIPDYRKGGRGWTPTFRITDRRGP